MEFKKTYEKSEVQQLMEWFKKSKSKLPHEYQINKAQHTNDLHITIDDFCKLHETCWENATYSGYIYQFFCLKEKLIADGYAEE